MVRILLADDQNLMRQALKVHLQSLQDIEVIASAKDGLQALELIENFKPDVALIDMEMPGIDGLSATRTIVRRFPNTKVLILSSHDGEEYIQKALQAGAKGYLLKNTSVEELASAIRAVDQGYFQLGPGLYEKIVNSWNSKDETNVIDSQLLSNVSDRLNTLEKNFRLIDRFQSNNLETSVINTVERKTTGLKKELLSSIDEEITNLKQDITSGLQVFQRKVFQQMQDEWNEIKTQVQEQQTNDRVIQEQKMIQVQLLRLRENQQKLEKQVHFTYNLLLATIITLLVIGLFLIAL